MGTIPSTELWHKWKVDDVTVEMAIGFMIQQIMMLEDKEQAAAINRVQLQQTLADMQETLHKLRVDVDLLMTHTHLPVKQKSKRNRKSK